MDWIVWVQTTPGAQTQAANLGYSTLAPGVIKRVVDSLATVKCANGSRPLTDCKNFRLLLFWFGFSKIKFFPYQSCLNCCWFYTCSARLARLGPLLHVSLPQLNPFLKSVLSHLLSNSRSVPTTILNYVGDGSSAGIANIIANNVDFAGSDATLTAAQYVVFVLLFQNIALAVQISIFR